TTSLLSWGRRWSMTSHTASDDSAHPRAGWANVRQVATIEVPAPASRRIPYRAFQDIDAYLEDLYAVYSKLYGQAPLIEYEQQIEDRHAFDYCMARKFFVLVVPYTSHRGLLVERVFTGQKLAWTLIGGSVQRKDMETFIDAAHRHASKTIASIELGEIEPVAF